MDVGRTPGVRVVQPGIRPWANGQEPVHPLCIRQTAAHAEEIRIEGPGPLIAFVQVAAGGVGLPDLQKCVRDRISTVVEHAAGHNDALANGLTPGSGVAREVRIFRRDRTDSTPGTGQLRERQWHIDERERRSPSPRGLIGLVQVGWEDLPIPPHDVADCDLVHASSWLASGELLSSEALASCSNSFFASEKAVFAAGTPAYTATWKSTSSISFGTTPE